MNVPQNTYYSSQDIYPTCPITDIEFGMFTQDTVKANAALVVNNEKLQSSSFREDGTLLDRRFGSQENEMCVVCNQVQSFCIGHFGMIISNTPYIIPSTSKILLSILNLFCQECGSIKNKDIMSWDYKRYELEKDKLNGKTLIKRKHALKLNNSKSTCHVCNSEYVKYKLDNGYIVSDQRVKTASIQKISNEQLFAFAEKISYRMIKLLGVNYRLTEFFYKDHVPVPPISIRPNKSNIADDLTISLRTFLNKNHKIRDNVDPSLSLEVRANAQLTLCAYDNSEQYGLTKNKTPFKSLTTSQKGKENRARGNLQARRTDYNSRTVIGPKSDLRYGVLNVPKYFVDIALHNMRVYVTSANIGILQTRINEGDTELTAWWDAERKEKINLRTNVLSTGETKKAIVLKVGDHIERKLRNGDIVMFVRQPSLHRENMVAMRVFIDTVSDSKTFQFHPDTVKPFNADFDGDEMNIFTSMDPRALIEQRFLMTFEHNYISCSDGGNNYGSLLSSLVGCYLMTQDKVHKEVLLTCFQSVKKYALKPFPIDKYTDNSLDVFDVLSCFLPSNLTTDRGGISIKNGQIVSKTPWTKKQVGVKESNAVPKIIYDLTNNARLSMDISFAFTTMFDLYLIQRGFTTSLRDFLIDRPLYDEIVTEKNEQYNNILDVIREFEFRSTDTTTELIPLARKRYFPLSAVQRESIPFNFVNDAVQFNNIQRSLISLGNNTGIKMFSAMEDKSKTEGRSNNILVSMNSNTKVSKMDIFLMTGVCGQQDIAGRLIQRNLNNRTYPYYPRDVNDPRAFGFILSSLHDGLRGDEMNNMGSSCKRQVVDVTCKTADTGYRGRQLIKHLEDCFVDNFHNVVDRSTLIQLCYNGIKIDPNNTKFVPLIPPSDLETNDKLLVPKKNITVRAYIQKLYDDILPSLVLPNRRDIIKRLRFPVDVQLLINQYPDDDMPVQGFDYHFDLIDWIKLNIFFEMSESNIRSIEYVILTNFHPSRIGNRMKYMDNIVTYIKDRYTYCCNTGLPAGIITGQEIQELSTQGSLSSFHVTDTFTINKSGFERYKQITQLNKNASKKINQDGFGVSITCEERHDGKRRLEEILGYLKFFSFKFLEPEVIITKNTFKSLFTLTEIRILKVMLPVFGVTIHELRNMLDYWLSTTTYINNPYVKIQTTDTTVSFMIHCNFADPVIISLNRFVDGIFEEITSGKISASQARVEHLPIYYGRDGKSTSVYTMNIMIDSMEIFSNFDTIDMDIHFPSPWISYLVYNIAASSQCIMNEIADAYEKKEEVLIHSNMIAAKMCAAYEPVAIDRFTLPDSSVLRDYAFETGQLVIPIAGSYNHKNKINDNASCIITSQTVKLGTGLLDLKIDLDMINSTVSTRKDKDTTEDDSKFDLFKQSIY